MYSRHTEKKKNVFHKMLDNFRLHNMFDAAIFRVGLLSFSNNCPRPNDEYPWKITLKPDKSDLLYTYTRF